MKKLTAFLFIAILAIIHTGCIVNYEGNVDACFYTEYTTYQVNEKIYLKNCSTRANSYSWDFGDGTYSRLAEPVISFAIPGTYEIKLTAYNNNSNDVCYATIQVRDNNNTKLDIKVMYKGTNDPVSNCLVTLYTTENDWVEMKNPLASATTSNNGIIIFGNLNSIRYYIDAYRKVSNTTYYSNEKLEYVTDILTPNVTNYFDAYVELLTVTKNKIRVYKLVEMKRVGPRN